MGSLPDRLRSFRRRHLKSPESTFDDKSILSQDPSYWYKLDLRRNTRARRIFALIACGAYFISFVFLILIELGSTNKSKVLGDIYFFRLSLANIIPESVANAQLINSIARGIGLHDFYQPGLWGYCEGYDNEGVTFCSKPESYYWFNIVQVILDELLAGATIALPSTLTEILNILMICSHIMFALFLAGTVLAFVMVFLSPVAIFSRWASLPMAFLSSVTFICIFAGSVIGSVISFVFKYAATAQSTLNINASVGTKMFVFMWIATGFAFIGFVLHAGMGCCCTSRRDLKTGKKPMRHSSLKRAMSQRSASGSMHSNMPPLPHARSVSIPAAGPSSSHTRNISAFSFEQQPAGSNRGRSSTLVSMNLEQISENAVKKPDGVHSRSRSEYSVSRSNTVRSNNSGSQVSRSNTIKGDVSRSNTLKSVTGGVGGDRARSNTLRSIRFQDERPPSLSNESDTTAVDSPDGSKIGQPSKSAKWPLPEED
ncbi:unnamed protein product [Discula destructiva]